VGTISPNAFELSKAAKIEIEEKKGAANGCAFFIARTSDAEPK
jgi:hypothetical protein